MSDDCIRISIRGTTVKVCMSLSEAKKKAKVMANKNKRAYDVWNGGLWVELVRPSK